MKLYIIRHGQTDWNAQRRIQGTTDIELNEQGMTQAGELAAKIIESNYIIDKVYSSNQKRAIQTAEIIADALGVKTYIEKDLHEMNLGKWEGMTWNEVKERYPKEYEEWYENRGSGYAPDGESYDQVLERALRVLCRIIKENDGNVAVVTHGAVILCLRCFLANIKMSFQNPFLTENASIYEVEGEQLLKLARLREEKELKK